MCIDFIMMCVLILIYFFSICHRLLRQNKCFDYLNKNFYAKSVFDIIIRSIKYTYLETLNCHKMFTIWPFYIRDNIFQNILILFDIFICMKNVKSIIFY